LYDASLKQIVETHLDITLLAATPAEAMSLALPPFLNDSSSSGVHESNFKAEPSDPVVPMLYEHIRFQLGSRLSTTCPFTSAACRFN
jgi:hypothetical protein